MCWKLPPLLSLLCVCSPAWSWDVGTGVGSIWKKLVEENGASWFTAGSSSGRHVILAHIWPLSLGINLRITASPCTHRDTLLTFWHLLDDFMRYIGAMCLLVTPPIFQSSWTVELTHKQDVCDITQTYTKGRMLNLKLCVTDLKWLLAYSWQTRRFNGDPAFAQKNTHRGFSPIFSETSRHKLFMLSLLWISGSVLCIFVWF